MKLAEAEFINRKYLNYTEACFEEIFGSMLVLEEKSFSNQVAGMGFFKLNYSLPSKSYDIIFEYERLFFTITVKRKKDFYHLFANHSELSNHLREKDIRRAIIVLREEIDTLEFCSIGKNGRIKKGAPE